MTPMKLFAAAGLAASAAAAPLAAQYYPQYPQQQTYPPDQYPQGYPDQQQYPQPYPNQGYPNQNYPNQNYPNQNYPNQTYPYGNQQYGQGYGATEGAVIAVVDGLIGNRYVPADRQAIHSCAWAAVQRARSQYPYPQPYGGAGPYGRPYQPYVGNPARVSAITSVERRGNGVRVRGFLDTGLYHNRSYGYGSGAYAASGDLGFRCDVDYRGYVYDVRLDRIGRPY